MTPEELLSTCAGVILDFDGPMAALMPPPYNRQAADAVRAAVGLELPAELETTTDHLAVLRHFAGRPELETANAAAARAEVECARRCDPAPWLAGLFASLDTTGRRWAVATNNVPEAVETFLTRFHYSTPAVIAGRTVSNVKRLKPDPHLVGTAADALATERRGLVFVGDSVSDVTAGRAAGVPVLGYAKDAVRAHQLQEAGAAAIYSMA